LAGSRRRSSAWLGALAASVLGLSSAGCTSAPLSPTDTLHQLAVALRGGDAQTAYALMSRRYRDEVSFEAFEHYLASNPEEVQATADALDAPREVVEEATVNWAEDESLLLRREGDDWRLVTDVANYYGRRTPRETVRTLLRAIEHHRYDVIVQLMVEAERGTTTAEALQAEWEGPSREETARLVSALHEALRLGTLEEHGDRAVVPYGDRFRMVLTREAGVWCIEDPE
jgi:hypothetical protein